MQTQGSLAEANLASLLHTMQSERATGTLSLEDGQSTCALYFLFGHLFHAAGPSGQGEDVVVDALTWPGGTYKFDPRAKLPAEETIKASPSDLISEAEHRGGAAVTATQWAAGAGDGPTTATAEGATATAEPPAAYVSHWGPAQQERATPAAQTPSDQAAGEEAAAVPAAEHPDVDAYDPIPPSPTGRSVAGVAATYSSWSPPAEEAAAPVEEPARTAGAWTGMSAPSVPQTTAAAPDDVWSPTPPPPAASPAPPTPTASPAPSGETGDGPAVAGYGRRAGDAAPLADVYPLPSGKPIYEALKSAFVDFPKLLTSLRKDGHTGYVRLTGDAFTGVLVFHNGDLLEALARDKGQKQGEAAFKDFHTRMEAGEGVLDVITLASDTVAALAQLLMARPLFTGLLGRFVNFKNLVEYLEEERVDGSVIVATDTDCGVILLRAGAILGTYTNSQATLESTTTAIESLAAERSARIEVKGGAGPMNGIDVEHALAQ